MAKQSGLGWTTFEVDDSTPTARDIKNDITNVEFSTPRAVQDITGLDKYAMERLLLLGDFQVTMNGVFNPAANMSHDVFSDLSASDAGARTINIVVASQTLANECLLTDYSLNRADDGSLTWSAPAVLQDGTVPVWS